MCVLLFFLDISWERCNSALCTVEDFLPWSYSCKAAQ